MQVGDTVLVHTDDEFNGLIGVISRIQNGFVHVRFPRYGSIEFPFSVLDLEKV